MIRRIFSGRKRTIKDSAINEEYNKKYNTTLRQWLVNHHKNIIFDKVTWMGVQIWKNPMDLWIYQELISKIKPDIIVEIGSASGGSTLYLAHLCDILNHGQVISVDISRETYNVEHPRITTFTGDSLSPEIVKEIHDICQNKTVLIIHDADHHEDSVYKNLEVYSGLVSVGSYFIVEDGIIDIFTPREAIGGHSGPLNATLNFLKVNSDFIVDESCERYSLTYNPKGFLKRVK